MKKKLHILLVEDDPDDIELLETAFKDDGVVADFSVISQGDKVMPFLEGCQVFPDVVLLDLNLPKVHGKDILTNIKAATAFNNIPVFILTTSSAQTDIDFCIKAGAQHYFTKPTRLAGFKDIVIKVANFAQH